MTLSACSLVFVAGLGQLSPLSHRQTFSDGLDNPARLAVTDTQVLVADTRSNRVIRFDRSGNLLAVVPIPEGPAGVGVAADGRVYVSLRDDKTVAVFGASFSLLSLLGSGVVVFSEPGDIAVDDARGRIYVVDGKADRVYGFDSAGNLVLILGNRGGGNGQFRYPSAIAVDPANGQLIVADQDNFRVQIFTANGLFVSKFGYRTKYVADGSEGWLPRTAGVAVDANSTIYIVDALMGTLRVFTTLGAELGKVVDYGPSPALNVPGDVAIDPVGLVYVTSSNAGLVEVYDPPLFVTASWSGAFFVGSNASSTDSALYVLRASRIGARRWPDGFSLSDHKVLQATTGGWDPPHMLDDVSCGRCHDVDEQPEGHLGITAGQANLCLSCHTGAGQAGSAPLRHADRETASGSPAGTGGRSHAWGVPAVNAEVGSVGPIPGSEVERYLDQGQIKCATCHNQHNNDRGVPLLRQDNSDGALCGGCHTEMIGHTPAGRWQPTCAECHDMHNPRSANLSLVNTVVFNRTLGTDKPVVFTATVGPNSFDDGDPAAMDGICQVCHVSTTYHTQDGSGVPHNDGQNCIGCHPHEAGFMPAGGSCTGCHANPQDNGDGVPAGGRRAVVGEFPVGDTHAHYGAELDGAACVVCHDQTTHMDGYIDLIDPDDGSVYTFIHAAEVLSDPDPSDFCAHCHDADGAARLSAPLDPFGNGNVPPDVASKFQGTLQWDQMYGDSCFGTEGTLRGVNSHHDISDADQLFSGAKIECLSCHGVHTASASQPVSDPFNTQAAWSGSTSEFCLTCHGGGAGPLSPSFPAGVVPPGIDTTDPRWSTLGVDWSVALGGACMTDECSSLRGIDTCENVEGPWFVDYMWTHSTHGPNSKRGWAGYSGAMGADLDCLVCHDPHGSWTATNPAGNPYMIRDAIDGTSFVDDGARTLGFNGPPFQTFGVARAVQVGVNGTTVDWGAADGLCSVCHGDWLAAYDFHAFCNACQTCHGHGMAWNESDWVDFDDDVPCPAPLPLTNEPDESERAAGGRVYESQQAPVPPLHQCSKSRPRKKSR